MRLWSKQQDLDAPSKEKRGAAWRQQEGKIMTTLPDPLDPLRKAIAVLLSPPVLLMVGGGSVYYAIIGLPHAIANFELFLAGFHLAELVVGFLCLIPPLIAILWLLDKGAKKTLDRAERGLERLSDVLKRYFPDGML
jgi:hypothetical protein